MKKLLIAGSTGYLGSHITQHIQRNQVPFKALARNAKKLQELGIKSENIIEAQVTDRASLVGCCEGIDVVISALGITRQKDGLSYMDVDYQANKNLLEEAIKSGVKKFIYVSVLRGQELTHLQICAAKEKFVQELQQSGIDYSIVRPSGFYSDLAAFYEMAKGGRVYLFGDGQTRLNPIHGADLAKVCVDAVYEDKKVIEIGGKEVMTHQEIADLAFAVAGKKPRFTYIPDWIRKLLLRLASIFMSKAKYGTTEFFLNAMALDMTTYRYGQHTLKGFFAQLKAQEA